MIQKIGTHLNYQIRRLKRSIQKIYVSIANVFSKKDINQQSPPVTNTLRLEPGDEIVFSSRQDTNIFTDYTEDMWERPNIYLKQGYLTRNINDTVSVALTQELSLPFLITDLHVSFVAQGNAIIQSVLYNNGTSIPFFSKTSTDLPSQISASRTLSTPTHSITIKIFCRQKDQTPGFIHSLKITADFFYNIRTLHSIEPSCSLYVQSAHNRSLSVSMGLSNQYNNRDAYKPVSGSMIQHDNLISVTITPSFPSRLFEYFLFQEGTDFPVSPSYYYP